MSNATNDVLVAALRPFLEVYKGNEYPDAPRIYVETCVDGAHRTACDTACAMLGIAADGPGECQKEFTNDQGHATDFYRDLLRKYIDHVERDLGGAD